MLVEGGGLSALGITVGILEGGISNVILVYRKKQFAGGSHHHPSSRLIKVMERHMASGRLQLRTNSRVVGVNGTHVRILYQDKPPPHPALTYDFHVDFVVPCLGSVLFSFLETLYFFLSVSFYRVRSSF